MSWEDWALSELDVLRRADRLRRLVVFDGNGVHGSVGGRRVVSFASNDYLGLARHPLVRAAAHAAIDQCGTGSTSSRLIAGTKSLHAELETAIAAWKRCERALVFPSRTTSIALRHRRQWSCDLVLSEQCTAAM